MSSSKLVRYLSDRGGRRSGTDQRQFSYTLHIPERRSDQDRRSGKDRRIAADFAVSKDGRKGIERRSGFAVASTE